MYAQIYFTFLIFNICVCDQIQHGENSINTQVRFPDCILHNYIVFYFVSKIGRYMLFIPFLDRIITRQPLVGIQINYLYDPV